MSRLSAKVLLLLTAMAGIASTACQSGGVGDPCIPEDEYNANFTGYSETEVNVESRSFQCETRVCLVANFRGRVSCPFGQAADPMNMAVANPNLAPDDRCYFPGTKEAQANQIAVPVDPQLVARSPDKAVYCSCRCDGPDKSAQYCDCPSGYTCQKLIDAYGTSGGAELAGSYCIKDGTAVQDPTTLTNTTNCSQLPPTVATLPPPKGCGPKHPAGLGS